MGTGSAHSWVAAALIVLNSDPTALPEITTSLRSHQVLPGSNDERRLLIEQLLKYVDDSREDRVSYLDSPLLTAMYKEEVGFDVAVKKHIALRVSRLLDDGIRMFGVELDTTVILFRGDDREITNVSTALMELPKAVVSTTLSSDVGDKYCERHVNPQFPCIIYEFHVAAGTQVLHITAKHPFLDGYLIADRFVAHVWEQEVLLPKGLIYELRSTEAERKTTKSGRSVIVYTVDVHQ